MKQRLISLCILLGILTSFSGCSSGNSADETVNAAGSQAEEAESSENYSVEAEEGNVNTETVPTSDGLADTDLGGYTYCILNYTPDALSWANTRIYADEVTGDAVNDALFNRRAAIETRFSAVLTTEETADIVGVTNSAVAAGDSLYQSVFIGEATGIASLLSSCLAWDKIPHLQLDQPHWNPEATSIYLLGGKQTALAGNISLAVASRAVCTVFNKRIFTERFPDANLYDDVRNNHWTLDSFFTYAENAAADLDGDGIWTKADQYGLNMGRGFKGYVASLLGGAGYHFTEENDVGEQVFTLHTNEETLNFMMKLMDELGKTGFYYNEDTTVHSFAPSDFFSSGHALFTQGVPHDVEKLRDMDDDIGILPMPKLNEDQEHFYSASWGGEALVLPKTVRLAEEGDKIGTLLEAMSFAGYYDVIPLYKEVALKGKTARDEESSDMLDIVFSGASFDFGTNILYDSILAQTVLTGIWNDKSADSVVSICTKNEKQISSYINKQLTKLIEQLPLE